MIVYNSTTKVRWDILEAWISWQLEEQIPAILATSCFDGHRFYRLLEQEEEDGPTFILQFFTTSLDRYHQFLGGFAPALDRKGQDRWGDGTLSFRTLMESLDAAAQG